MGWVYFKTTVKGAGSGSFVMCVVASMPKQGQ